MADVVERLPDTSPPAGSRRDPLVLSWEEREKTRQRATTAGGREIVIKLATGTRLPPGTVVVIGDGFYVEVAAAEEDVWVVRSADVRRLCRAAYEIGNRHFAIAFGDGEILVRYDHTLEELWRRIGIEARRARRPFLSDQRIVHEHG